MCNLYILYSKNIDKYYIGHTCDQLSERLRRHNTNHKGFTGRTNDWALIYKEEYMDKVQAASREKQLKRWKNRKRIEKLIQKD